MIPISYTATTFALTGSSTCLTARATAPGSCATASSHRGEADAKTSTGAPSEICVARLLDDENVKRTRVPGFACSKTAPICGKTALRDAAAATVISVGARAPADEH